jgi:hypothetical protein
MFAAVVLIEGSRRLFGGISGWAQQIRDEYFLVGRKLHNINIATE